MNKVLLLLLGITIAFAAPLEEEPTQGGWFMPQLDGSFEWMSVEELQTIKDNVSKERAAGPIKFYVFTSTTAKTEVALNDATALKNSKFNKANPTRFIIHGWNNNYNSDVNTELRAAFFSKGAHNVISVDWSSMAQTANYASAVANVPDTGKTVASFIDFLFTSGGMSFSTLQVVGHSLGAHVSGFAGKNVKKGKIFQITGLDPALPGFSYSDANGRLNTGDASFVESIQTNGGTLGFLEPIGKAAFYPNGGKSQPGCGVDLVGSCAHGRSYQYLAEAIRKNDFPTMKCGNYQAAVAKNCGATYSSVRMGASNNYASANGQYYVPVNSGSPFGMA